MRNFFELQGINIKLHLTIKFSHNMNKINLISNQFKFPNLRLLLIDELFWEIDTKIHNIIFTCMNIMRI